MGIVVEDVQVIGKVLTALGDTLLTLEGLMPTIWEYGPHKLYQWQFLTRDDGPFDAVAFQENLHTLNRSGRYKPQLYSVEEYPAEEANFHRAYLTVYI